MPQRSNILAGIVCIALFGCTSAQPALGTRAFTVTWKANVAMLLSQRCGACHGDAAAGGYRVDSYARAIGASDRGGVVAVAGDPTSRLLTVLDPRTARPPHAAQDDLHRLLVTWVVDDRLAYQQSRVHGGGLLDPASSEFHGAVLERGGWSFPLCQSCHGTDFAGGITGVTCLSCHVDSPTSCTTCHGTSPTTGAHALHVLGGALLGKRHACTECHATPATWDAPGHIRGVDGKAITGATQVLFGDLARTPTPRRDAPPAFDAGRCSNVYCHGTASPEWSSKDPTSCTSCHGQPPSGHPVGACAACHGGVIDGAGQLRSPALHVSGRTTLGDGSGTCQACHPTASLSGAHTSHVAGSHRLAAPIACGECHLVPTAIDSAGHFTADGLAAVFPTGGTGPLASAEGAMPTYAASTTRCANTYCHGNGTSLAHDGTIEIIRDPVWQAGSGAGRCGTCHGLPPLDGVHDPAWQITQCAQCHPRSVDAFGQILIENGVSKHLNGVVDAP